MNKRQRGFTLIEIMVAIFVLVIGLSGILILFPKGIEQTKIAVEETQAALVAQSAYNALRNSVKQMSDPNLVFIHDGMDSSTIYDMSTLVDGESYGIPAHNGGDNTKTTTSSYAAVPTNNDFKDYCRLATGTGDSSMPFNIDYSASNFSQDPDANEKLKQYSFNIQISRVATNPDGLYDVAIHVRRGVGQQATLIRSFYTQITIPN